MPKKLFDKYELEKKIKIKKIIIGHEYFRKHKISHKLMKNISKHTTNKGMKKVNAN